MLTSKQQIIDAITKELHETIPDFIQHGEWQFDCTFSVDTEVSIYGAKLDLCKQGAGTCRARQVIL